jgi:two-component system cell cycle response regulator
VSDKNKRPFDFLERLLPSQRRRQSDLDPSGAEAPEAESDDGAEYISPSAGMAPQLRALSRPLEEESSLDRTQEFTISTAGSRFHSGRRGLPTLRVVAGTDLLRYSPMLPGDRVVMGRDDSADLVLTDTSVSRAHAAVRHMEDGRIVLEDLDSTNGTTVNGEPVTSTELRFGDRIELGGVLLRLDCLGADELSHLAKIQDRLRAADRDTLTGLRSRAWLDRDLPLMVQRYQRAGKPMATLFVDLDHFKRINDTFGHAVGDEVLRTTGRLLMLNVRDNDVCVRYGGEELAIFLPGADEALASDIAERIRAALETHDWSRTAEALQVSASIGVAQLRTDEAIGDWLERADRALYDAKSAGRNQVQLAA